MKVNRDTEWDWSGWRDYSSKNNPYTQKDWNQTLVTRFNMISSIIFSESLMGGANRIRVNDNILDIIESLEFYDSDKKMLGEKFKVIVDNLILDDIIYVYSDKIEGEPKIYPDFETSHTYINEIGDTEREVLNLKIKPLNKTNIIEFRKKLIGTVKILNYDYENQ